MKNEKVRKINNRNNRKAANIYDLDIYLEETQIEKTLKEAINLSKESRDMEIKALRSMFGGRKTATVITSIETINKMKNIRI